MSQERDNAILRETQEGPDASEFNFHKRNLMSVPDINQGSYVANTIDFNLDSLATTNKYVNWKGSFLTVPLVLTVSTDAGAGVLGADADSIRQQIFAASMKNNTANLIHSMSIALNQNPVVTIQGFNNLMFQYKMLHSYSLDDVHNSGSAMGFGPLSAASQSFEDAIAPGGYGVSNNQIKADAAFDPANGYTFRQNKERLKRMMKTSFYDASTENAKMMDAGYANKQYKDNVKHSGAGLIVYHVLATIRMDLLHDYFDKVGLIRNSNYRMTFNTNANSSASFVVNAGALKSVSVQSPNRTLPFMVSPIDISGNSTGFPIASVVCDITVKVELTIVKGSSTAYNHPMGQCQMNLELFTMDPDVETKYLADPVKTILFSDYKVYNSGALANVAPGADINFLMETGLTRVRKLLIFPFITGTSVSNPDTANKGINAMESPFSEDCSNLASAYCSIDNFNVELGGENLYNRNIKYGFEHFLYEVHSDGNISSGLNPGLSSGLIDRETWDTYPHITVNLNRKSKVADDVAQAIKLNFSNSSKYTCDYVALICYEKEVQLNKATGMIII
jgi:hypothetical protein